ATLILVIYLTDPSTAPLKIANNVVTDPIDPGDDDEDRIDVSWSDVPALSLSELPGGLSLWPPALTLSFAPPTISFLNDTTETEQTEPSTTQEAV
ncbi:MAG TPA: hypothetical protein VNL70_03910, partial [Tepidisphaeraceae bacterium]|nr:hypothetical protein [Tepidisphaeraceae bacterium]